MVCIQQLHLVHRRHLHPILSNINVYSLLLHLHHPIHTFHHHHHQLSHNKRSIFLIILVFILIIITIIIIIIIRIIPMVVVRYIHLHLRRHPVMINYIHGLSHNQQDNKHRVRFLLSSSSERCSIIRLDDRDNTTKIK